MKLIVCTFLLIFWSSALLGQTNLGEEKILSSQQLPYLVSLPEDYDPNSSTAYPLLLFLHGGDRSSTRHHPKKYANKNDIPFPFIVIAPHCKAGCSWGLVDFNSLLTEVLGEYAIDSNRIYLTGYSMGGYGSWDLLARSPQWFAAAAPIASGGNPDVICKAKEVNIRAYHGDKDNVVPKSKSEQMIDALKQCGAKAEIIIYPGADHGSWIKVYQDAEFYTWLLIQSK